MTPEEYRLVSGDRTLGTIPVDRPLGKDSFVIFAGRRWLVLDVDTERKVITLSPAKGGKAPLFNGQAGWAHDRVRKEMFDVYAGKEIPKFLDSRAMELLDEARGNFHRLALGSKRMLAAGRTSYLFPWMGDRANDTLAAMLRARGLKATNEGIAVAVFDATLDKLADHLKGLLEKGPPDAYELARSVSNKATEKYDMFLSEELLCADYGVSKLDTNGAYAVVKEIAAARIV
jgi:ATP-dependent Lhr-like helicase